VDDEAEVGGAEMGVMFDKRHYCCCVSIKVPQDQFKVQV